jgi:acyl-CoA dehydrogenase
MDFAYSPKVQELQERLRSFLDQQVLPADSAWHEIAERGDYPLAVVDPLKAAAKAAGLWNLFLPGLKPEEPGTRLTNLEYAPLAELMGRIPWSAELFNCNAPDTGNMELLHLFATPQQYARWLRPLLEGEIRSSPPRTRPTCARPSAARARSTSSTAASGSRPARCTRAASSRSCSACRTRTRRPSGTPGIRWCWCQWTHPACASFATCR